MTTYKGMESISTESSSLRYNLIVAHVDDNTDITTDNSSKSVTNFAIKPLEEGFKLLLFHALKISGDHVDKAEIVASWHFDSLHHLKDITDKINISINKY
jgi:hypothetical protein